jgi:D-3-phosphoglycerate dehydrogenase
MKVAILDDYTQSARQAPGFARLAGQEVEILTERAIPNEVLAQRLGDVEVLVLIRERSQIGEALISRLPKLKVIAHFGFYPNIDVGACTRQGIMVCVGPPADYVPTVLERGAASTAELTWALILAAARRLPQQVAALKRGVWQTALGRSLKGKTLGIYGYGHIGAEIAAYGRAFGMEIQVWGREGSQTRAAADGLRVAASREAFFETSDVVSLHVVLSPESRGIIGAAEFALMKPGAIFVNTSRGPLVDTNALVEALKAGRLGMAAVDVFDGEPVVDPAHPLLTLDNAICTPHLGYATKEQLEALLDALFAIVEAYAAGKPLAPVNAAALALRTSE